MAKAASINYDQSWIESAPLLIVLCTKSFDSIDSVGLNRFPSLKAMLQALEPELYAAVNMEEHQIKIPGEHMVLAALERGIHSTWISSFDCEKAKEILKIQGYLVSNILALGYPKELNKPKRKKDLSEITFTNYFCDI